MTRSDIINALAHDLARLIDRYRNVDGITYAEVVGVLEHMKFNMLMENRANAEQKEGE